MARLSSAWLLPLASVAATAAHASVYLSVEQAQAAMFPHAGFSASAQTLTAVQVAAIQKRSGARVLSPQLRAWRVSTGGWFIVDRVIGHDGVSPRRHDVAHREIRSRIHVHLSHLVVIQAWRMPSSSSDERPLLERGLPR